MKRFTTGESELYIGTGAELLSIYRSIEKAYERGATNTYPMFSNMPYAQKDKMYGLDITSNRIMWLSANTALAIIAETA